MNKDMTNYDNRRFVSRSNTANGEVDASTVFHHRQQGQVVRATYAGANIEFGTLIAKVNDNDSLDMRYSHVNTRGEIMTGKCHSTPELPPRRKTSLARNVDVDKRRRFKRKLNYRRN